MRLHETAAHEKRLVPVLAQKPDRRFGGLKVRVPLAVAIEHDQPVRMGRLPVVILQGREHVGRGLIGGSKVRFMRMSGVHDP